MEESKVINLDGILCLTSVIMKIEYNALKFVLSAAKKERLKSFFEVIHFLNYRDATVIKKRFGLDCDMHTLEEVAKLMHVTRDRVRQIEVAALSKLRIKYREQLLCLMIIEDRIDPVAIEENK